MSTADAVEDARRRLRAAVLTCLADLDPATEIGVGVSGGPDSLALARAAAAAWPHVRILVVDHGLQPESSDIAARAVAVCRDPDRGIAVAATESVRVTVDQGPGRGGPEAAARDARRAALLAWAERTGLSAVLLGHTREDQAETVLLRLARGSGARALAAMAPVDGIWRRPFLDVPRAIVRAAVADLAAWSDPHNEEVRFARVRVRTRALPALVEAVGEDAVDGLTRSAALLRDDADALDALAAEALSASRAEGPGVDLEIDSLVDLPRAIRTRVLRRAAIAAGSPPGSLTRDHVLAMDALITHWHGQGPLALPGPVAVQRRYGRLLLGP